MRLVENNLKNEFLEKEKQSILEIQQMVETNTDKYTIISSKHQISQLYTKLNRSGTPISQKDALSVVIAFCKSFSGESTKNDPPYVDQMCGELLRKIQLPDREDAKHIVIAWLRQANYFVTVDWKSILNLNEDRMIESALESMVHPQLFYEAKVVEITNPANLQKRFMNK